MSFAKQKLPGTNRNIFLIFFLYSNNLFKYAFHQHRFLEHINRIKNNYYHSEIIFNIAIISIILFDIIKKDI